MFGSSTKIQAIVCRMPGMISGTSDAANISGFPGTSVRTIRYASTLPITTATAAEPSAKASELPTIVPIPTAV